MHNKIIYSIYIIIYLYYDIDNPPTEKLGNREYSIK